MPKVTKRRLNNVSEECWCEFCGWPIMYPDNCYEIQDMEFYGFCSKGCAYDYLHNSDYEPMEA